MIRKECAENVEAEMVRVRRRQDRAALTRYDILKAATAEFAAVGFDGATTRSIAARAKVQHSLVIYHFRTKLGIWQAVMKQALEAFDNAFRKRMEELKGSTDATRLHELQRMFIRFAAERPELNWLMSHEVGGEGDSARVNWLVENTIGADTNVAIDLIKKVQRLGLYVEGDPTHLHYLFIGAASHIFGMAGEIRRTMGKSPFEKGFLERHIMLCERLFWRQPPEQIVAPVVTKSFIGSNKKSRGRSGPAKLARHSPRTKIGREANRKK